MSKSKGLMGNYCCRIKEVRKKKKGKPKTPTHNSKKKACEQEAVVIRCERHCYAKHMHANACGPQDQSSSYPEKEELTVEGARYSCNGLNTHPNSGNMSVTYIFNSLCIWLLCFIHFGQITTHDFLKRPVFQWSGLYLSCWHIYMMTLGDPQKTS